MSKPSRTIPTDARSGRLTAPNLPAWMIADFNKHAESERPAFQALQLELPAHPWTSDSSDDQQDGMLTLEL